MNLGNAGGEWRGLRHEDARIPTFPLSPNFCDVDAADLTGDGFVDLYFTNYDGEGVELYDRLLINDGTGRFTDSVFARLTQTMLDCRFGTAVRLVDMNLDGKRDIVRCTGVTGTGVGSAITVAYSDPAQQGFYPSFNYQQQVGSLGTYHVDVGDLNRDNRPDMIISDRNHDGYRMNVGTDALGRVIWGPLLTYSYVAGVDDGIAGANLLVDLDGDGWLDAVHSDFDVDVLGCMRRSHIFHNRGGVPGGQIVMKEEAGSAGNPWRGAIGFLESDLGGTYDVAAFDVENDGDIDLVYGRCSGTFVWLNQKDQWTPTTAYCAGDGTSAACPCGGVGAFAHGCPSSIAATGARLTTSGVARIGADSLTLTTTNVANAPGLYFQGLAATEIALGDGKLCAGTGIIRLGVVFAAGGTSFYPGGLTPNAIHAAGLTQAGDARTYQVWYRDSDTSFCTSATFNLTNGLALTWAP
jgi:hypothetical protein